jgi:DNA-binding CsgD family transcriptional regulator
MNKFLLMLILFATSLHAEELSGDLHFTRIAMGDLGSIKSSFNGDEVDESSSKSWAQLTDNQRIILSALGGEWDTLRPWQRAKMLDIAKDYPKMDAEKQLRVQRRLISWSRMTPYERENARIRYQHFHSLSAEKQAELRQKWTEHEKLSETEREKLRKESPELYYDPDVDQ